MYRGIATKRHKIHKGFCGFCAFSWLFFKGAFEIADQVLDVFDSDRDPYEPIGDSQPRALLGRYGGVRHGCGMRDQRFHSAKTFAERTKLHGLEESLCPIQAPEIERDHSTETRHLFFREVVSGVA